jgi:hypothetical protein
MRMLSPPGFSASLPLAVDSDDRTGRLDLCQHASHAVMAWSGRRESNHTAMPWHCGDNNNEGSTSFGTGPERAKGIEPHGNALALRR